MTDKNIKNFLNLYMSDYLQYIFLWYINIKYGDIYKNDF